MDYGITSWGSRLKLSLGSLARLLRTDFCLPSSKNTSQGIRPHGYRLAGVIKGPLMIKCRAEGRTEVGSSQAARGHSRAIGVWLSWRPSCQSEQECWGLRPKTHLRNVLVQLLGMGIRAEEQVLFPFMVII